MGTIDEMSRDVYTSYLDTALKKYLPTVAKWYREYYEHTFQESGAYAIEGRDVPAGLYARFTVTETHSAIKGIQAFCFVDVSALNLPKASGGVRKMITSIMGKEWYDLGAFEGEDWYCKLKQALVNTNNAAPFICFLPGSFMAKIPKGKFLWLSEAEIIHLAMNYVPYSVKKRLTVSDIQRASITYQERTLGVDTTAEICYNYSKVKDYLADLETFTVKEVLYGLSEDDE